MFHNIDMGYSVGDTPGYYDKYKMHPYQGPYNGTKLCLGCSTEMDRGQQMGMDSQILLLL